MSSSFAPTEARALKALCENKNTIIIARFENNPLLEEGTSTLLTSIA